MEGSSCIVLAATNQMRKAVALTGRTFSIYALTQGVASTMPRPAALGIVQVNLTLLSLARSLSLGYLRGAKCHLYIIDGAAFGAQQPHNCYPICNKILPKNGSLIFDKPGARKTQNLIFVHNLVALAHRDELCSFPKAPLLCSQSGVLGSSEHSIWYTKSTAFRVQERCFCNARVVLLSGENYTPLILKRLC
jgi:hypothetical protein